MGYDCLTSEQKGLVDAVMEIRSAAHVPMREDTLGRLVGKNHTQTLAAQFDCKERAMKGRLRRIYDRYGVDRKPFIPMVRLAYLRSKELGLLVLCLFVLGLTCQAQSSCPSPTPGAPHVCLKWTASPTSGVTYNIFRATTSGGQNYAAPLNSTPISGTSFYDATATIGTTYFYTATAVGTGGVLSQPSAEVSAQIPVPPAAPSGFSVSID